jgi:hypothetical protein
MAMQRPPLTSQENAEQIEIIIDVYDRSTSTVLHQAIRESPAASHLSLCSQSSAGLVSVEGSTRLSAVRWNVGGGLEESLRRRVRQSGDFWLLPDTLCNLHDSVSQLAGYNKRLSLRLMV